ncbi:unnamed protein product, partial [Amoebophrya sp. A25]
EPLVNRSKQRGHDLGSLFESPKRPEDYEYLFHFAPEDFLPLLARKHSLTLDLVTLGLMAITSYRLLLLSENYFSLTGRGSTAANPYGQAQSPHHQNSGKVPSASTATGTARHNIVLSPVFGGSHEGDFRLTVVAPMRDEADATDLVANLVSSRTVRCR